MNETEIIVQEETTEYDKTLYPEYSIPAQNPSQTQTRPQNDPGYGFSVAGMVCGIVSLVMFWPFGFIGGILGIIFSLISRRDGKMNGMAKAGLICGIIGLALFLLLLLGLILMVAGDINSFAAAGKLI